MKKVTGHRPLTKRNLLPLKDKRKTSLCKAGDELKAFTALLRFRSQQVQNRRQ